MNYLESLSCGQSFVYKDKYYIVTTDFKSNGDRLCINLRDGNFEWIAPNATIVLAILMTTDKDNNIIPIKISEKNYE